MSRVGNCSAVKEVRDEEVFLTIALVNFHALLTLAEVHEGVEGAELVDLEASEGIVELDAAEGVLSVGANGNDLALVLDAGHGVAETIELSDSASWDSSGLAAAWLKSDLVRMTLLVDDLAFAFAAEHDLELVEDGSKLHLGRAEQAELPGVARAPVEGPLWEVFRSHCALSNGYVVIRFNS